MVQQAATLQSNELLQSIAVGLTDEPTVAQPATGVTDNPYVDQVLRIGSSGPTVAHLQGMLNTSGVSLTADGIFGPMTRGAVVAFQQEAGVDVDGVVGPQTWGALSGGGSTTPDTGGPDHGEHERPPGPEPDDVPGPGGTGPGGDSGNTTPLGGGGEVGPHIA
ncbi:MAG: peptidoglycan-binding domain-containing protein [Bradymonadia bacterium]